MSNYDYKDIAEDYDDLVIKHNWQAPDLIYNNLKPYITRGDKLLDIGVGTGISSQRFYDDGTELYGADNSIHLLEVCRRKGKFKELTHFDINSSKSPFPHIKFDYLICSGVLHFFSDLNKIFHIFSSSLRSGGLLLFTLFENKKDNSNYYKLSAEGVDIYHHSFSYIRSMEKLYGFSLIKEEIFTTIEDLKSRNLVENRLITLKKV